MSSISSQPVPPSIPFHVARAYGVSAPRAVARKPASEPIAPVSPSARDEEARAKLARVIAARVPGGIDYSAEEPMPTGGGAIGMYRHPYDRNAAATGVHAGRVIDVVG